MLLLTVVVWGVNFAVVKRGLAELPPLAFNTVRFSAACVAIALAVRATGTRLRFARRHLPYLIGLGLLGNTAYQLLFIYGVAATTADNAALILATVPAWVALVGTAAGMERVAPLGWLGVAASLGGIVLIVLGSDRAATFTFGGATLAGDALILLCTLCWSAYTLLIRVALRHYPSLSVTAVSTLAGAVPLIALGWPDLRALDPVQVSPTAWAAAVFSGLFAIALGYFAWNYGISRLGSARTALYSNVIPPIALLTAWLWLGETLTPQQGWGALLAVAGVVLARRFARPRGLSGSVD